MNSFQKFSSAIAVASALSGCGNPIHNEDKFSHWTPEQAQSILSASSINELVKIPDLEKNIRKWISPEYQSWNMQVMQTTKNGFAGVEQNATVSIKFGEVKEGTFFARFTNPNNPEQFKDFAIICANGMLRGMHNLTFSEPTRIPQIEHSMISGPSLKGTSQAREYIIPQGGSLMGTLGVTRKQAEQIARLFSLPEYYKDGKYIVTVQPGTKFSTTEDSTGVQYGMEQK